MRIIKQILLSNGVLTTYEDNSIDILPYKIDENGEEYVELFPNYDRNVEKSK